MQITLEEVAMMLGQKDIEIFTLQKEIAALREQLKQKPEKE